MFPKLKRQDVDVVMKEFYEHQYGIYRHLDTNKPDRPLASVAFHPAEDVIANSHMVAAYETYVDKRIQKYFGLTVHEFLNTPKDHIEVMIAIADARIAKDNKDVSDALGNLPDLD